MTFRDIIDQVGISTLAGVLAVEESHVRTMKARDSIPPEYWAEVVGVLAERGVTGVTYESLRKIRNARFARGEAA